MGAEYDKFKHSKRLLKDDNAIKKQVKIAKSAGLPVTESHKFAKLHAMDCGNPKCPMCGNPRKLYKEVTQQEKRLFQDTDTPNDKHSNGLKNDEEDIL